MHIQFYSNENLRASFYESNFKRANITHRRPDMSIYVELFLNLLKRYYKFYFSKSKFYFEVKLYKNDFIKQIESSFFIYRHIFLSRGYDVRSQRLKILMFLQKELYLNK